MYIVITGASRGIGLELTRRALEKECHVLAIARKPEESIELMKLKEKYPKLSLLPLDLLGKNAAVKIKESIGTWPKLDVLINNAGIYLEDHEIADFEKTFLTNAIMPFFITRELLGELKKSDRPLSVQITSQMGSLEDNTSGGSYSYRASKTALNMLFKSLSIDESWLISLLIHPGWVQTQMGGKNAPVAPSESANGIWRIIEGAEFSQSGTFLNYLGKKIPW